MRTVKLVKSSSIAAIAADLAGVVEDDRVLAQAAAGTATTKANEAGASSVKASQWAENPEDVEVVTGEYSAKHYSLKAAASAAGIADSAEMLIKHEAEIASLENVINSANINQETTATATGVDTVALPKTAANTGMQVQLSGDSDATKNVLGTGRIRSVGNNLIKPTYIQGFQVSTTDGTFIAGATFSRSDYFRVAASTAYILSSNTNTGTDHRIAFYDLNKVFISGATQTSGQPISVTSPANAYYAIVSSLTTKVDTFRLTRGTSSFETYRESILQLTTPALRSNGLIKDEIRKGSNGYELVKRVGVGTLGAEKVVNGTFTTDTSNWTAVDSTLTVEDGMLKITNLIGGSSFPYAYQSFTTIVGKKYIVKLSHKNGTKSGLLRISTSSGDAVNYSSPALNDIVLTTRYVTFTATSTTTFIRLVSALGNIGDTTFFDNASIKEFTESDGLSTGVIFTEFGSSVNYSLATPTITPIAHAGLLNSNSNGTAYFEPIIADAGVYASNLAVQLTDYPISSFESIRKYANGTYTELNTATAVIASGGLSFTHPDLTAGDLVMFTYAYNRESIGRSMTLTHYDSRFIEADTANGKVYRIVPVVTNGVVSWTAVEV